MRLFYTEYGPKTHHRRSCDQCREYGYKAGCPLPFRKTYNLRKIANRLKKTIRQVLQERKK